MPTIGVAAKETALKFLRSGQRGVITRINTRQDITAQNLKNMGLGPGRTVILEQRFPRFKIRVGNNHLTLDDTAINSIYLRVLEDQFSRADWR